MKIRYYTAFNNTENTVVLVKNSADSYAFMHRTEKLEYTENFDIVALFHIKLKPQAK